MYELISYGNTGIRISTIGGHGFPVFTPPGHCLVSILSSGRHQITPLYHKTEAVKAIKTANQLSSMDRASGINFHPKKSGGYHTNADLYMNIRESQLNKAVVDGLVFL